MRGPFGGVEIMRRADVEFALRHPEVFSSAMEAVDLGQSVPLIPLQVDPPEHSKYRKLLDPIFAPKRMNLIEPDVVQLVNEFIDGFVDQGSCEFTTDLAEPLPSSVFLRLIGLPVSDFPTFLGMKNGILRPQGADMDEIKANQKVAAEDVERFFAAELADRRKNPKDDLLSMFATADVAGVRLTDDEILGICFLFLIAGLDTVTDSLECFFAYLAEHPEQRRKIVDDPSIIPSAVEELLRWETPVTMVARVAAQDTEMSGCPIHRGDSVGVGIGSANTDETGCPRLHGRPHPQRQAPGLRGGRPPLPRVAPGPTGVAGHPPRVAPAHPRLRDRAGHRAQLHVRAAPGRPAPPDLDQLADRGATMVRARRGR